MRDRVKHGLMTLLTFSISNKLYGIPQLTDEGALSM
jgi:hypothetical protein